MEGRLGKVMVIAAIVSSIAVFQSSLARAEAESIVDPNQMNVSGVRGATEVRNVYIRANATIQDLYMVPLDLKRSDGNGVLSASSMTIQQTSVKQGTSKEVSVVVGFNLAKVPRSGEYNGSLRLNYQGGAQVIPVTVRVKDQWFFPGLVLFAGTSLGIASSVYRSQGRPRDEVLVRVGQLRAQMQDDRDVAATFLERVESSLIDVRMALRGENLDDGQQSIKQAEIIWSKWLKGRNDWLAQIAYSNEIGAGLKASGSTLPCVREVFQALDDTVKDIPDLENPRQLRDKLDRLARQTDRIIYIQAQMKQLKGLIKDSLPSWQPKLRALEQQMEELRALDLESKGDFQGDLEAAIEEAIQQLSPQAETGAISKGSVGLSLAAPPLSPAPSTSLAFYEEIPSARDRLWWFTRISYATAIAFLGMTGFNQLYVDQPVFGASPVKDYFSLLVWGFGAEATRDAVAMVVQGWSLPGLK